MAKDDDEMTKQELESMSNELRVVMEKYGVGQIHGWMYNSCPCCHTDLYDDDPEADETTAVATSEDGARWVFESPEGPVVVESYAQWQERTHKEKK